jgi:hypothetical protein
MLPSAIAKMQRIRFTVGALMAGACACANSADRPAGGGPSANTAGTRNGAAGVGGAESGGGGGGSSASGGSTMPRADASDDVRPSMNGTQDAALADRTTTADDAPVVVVHNDAGPARTACTGDLAALGSSLLAAGQSTPPAFAAAYNEERALQNAPGPFLLALTGVNEGAPSGWTAIFGSLARTAEGAVTFDGARASVPFSMGSNRSVDIAQRDAQFDLALATPRGATLPITGVKLSGALANACSSLSVTSLELTIPASAASISFHGSTVGDLMRSGASGSAAQGPWPLELSGLAQQVYAVGIVDAGAEP